MFTYDIIAREQMLAYKNFKKPVPVCSSDGNVCIAILKVANQKWSNLRIVHLLSFFFFLQPAYYHNAIHTVFEIATK